jgi:hypothetical protein
MAEKKKTGKQKTRGGLTEWVHGQGGQAQAAAIVGVRTETLNRWLRGHIRPRGLSLRRLKELGVKLD